MLRLAVLVSGGGTNLQALIDAIASGSIQNAEIAAVISNKKDAYALERAKKHGIRGICVSPKDYESREAFHQALAETLDGVQAGLVVLAGYLVILPEIIIQKYRNQ